MCFHVESLSLLLLVYKLQYYETEFSLHPNVKYQKEILALQAHCPLKDCGCEWIGKLQEHKLHLDLDTGDCQLILWT